MLAGGAGVVVVVVVSVCVSPSGVSVGIAPFYMKRVPLRRTSIRHRADSTPLASRRAPLRRQSAKRAAEAPARAEVVRLAKERDGHRCVAERFAPNTRCAGRLEVDEMQGRGRQPGSHLNLEATQTLCSTDHLLKSNYPRLAGLLGLYGVEEQARRLEHDPQPLKDAVDEWARRKAQALGQRVGRGDVEAVHALRANRQPSTG